MKQNNVKLLEEYKKYIFITLEKGRISYTRHKYQPLKEKWINLAIIKLKTLGWKNKQHLLKGQATS